MNCKYCQKEIDLEQSLQCPHCRRIQQASAYTADSKRGLERLEREKLEAIKKHPLISKYEPDNIRRFELPEKTEDPFDFSDLEGPTHTQLRWETRKDASSDSLNESEFLVTVANEASFLSLSDLNQGTDYTQEQGLPWALNRAIKADDAEIKALPTAVEKIAPVSKVLRHEKIRVSGTLPKGVVTAGTKVVKKNLPSSEFRKPTAETSQMLHGLHIPKAKNEDFEIPDFEESLFEEKTLSDESFFKNFNISEISQDVPQFDDVSLLAINSDEQESLDDGAKREAKPLTTDLQDEESFEAELLETKSEAPKLYSLTSLAFRKREKLYNSLWLVGILLLLTGSFFLLKRMGYFSAHEELTPPSLLAAPSEKYSTEQIERAIKVSSETVHMAFDFEAQLLPSLKNKASLSDKPEEKLAQYQLAHDLFPQDLELTHLLARSLIEAKNYQEARQILRNSRDAIAFNETTEALLIRAFREDPHFLPATESIDSPDWGTISPLGGGSTLTFKIQNEGETLYAFKPLQTRRQSNYRSEIAAWRLCELIQCDFKIPYNKEIRIEKSAFFQMYNRSRSRKKEEYRPQLVDLIWTRVDKKEYLYGTLKEWIPDFTRFPIEFLSLWTPWLAQNDDNTALPELADALKTIQNRETTRKLYPKLLELSPQLTTPQLASQIAQILIFDFLTGNWDRFSGVEQWWGVNCQFSNNKITSIDNGASFQPYTNKKVHERFLLVQKVSKRFVRELHALSKEDCLQMLFPEPDARETKSFEQFWTQRTVLLSRIDSLIEEFGAESVYAFP